MTSKSDLIVALQEDGMPYEAAKAFAEKFVAEHPEPRRSSLPVTPGATYEPGGYVDPASAIPMMQGLTRKSGLPIPAINQHELKQRQTDAAVAAGYTLCQNCQQPTHAHLPGCSRVAMGGNSFAVDTRAITKDPLPPVG